MEIRDFLKETKAINLRQMIRVLCYFPVLSLESSQEQTDLSLSQHKFYFQSNLATFTSNFYMSALTVQ